MTNAALTDLLYLKFTRRKLQASEVRTMEAFHRLFRDQIYDLESEERHILRKLDLIEKAKAVFQTDTGSMT